jgi:hypothetical protein
MEGACKEPDSAHPACFAGFTEGTDWLSRESVAV